MIFIESFFLQKCFFLILCPFLVVFQHPVREGERDVGLPEPEGQEEAVPGLRQLPEGQDGLVRQLGVDQRVQGLLIRGHGLNQGAPVLSRGQRSTLVAVLTHSWVNTSWGTHFWVTTSWGTHLA